MSGEAGTLAGVPKAKSRKAATAARESQPPAPPSKLDGAKRKELWARTEADRRAWQAEALFVQDREGVAMAEVLRALVLSGQRDRKWLMHTAKSAKAFVEAQGGHSRDLTLAECLDACERCIKRVHTQSRAAGLDAQATASEMADQLLGKLAWIPSVQLRAKYPQIESLNSDGLGEMISNVAKEYVALLRTNVNSDDASKSNKRIDAQKFVRRAFSIAFGLSAESVKNLYRE